MLLAGREWSQKKDEDQYNDVGGNYDDNYRNNNTVKNRTLKQSLFYVVFWY